MTGTASLTDVRGSVDPVRCGAAPVRERFLPRAALSLTLFAFTGACGYHVSGHGDLMPKNVKTLAIHAMGLAATSGWTNPILDDSNDPNPADARL